jgi:uncharacterized protein (TIGR03437 family)
MRRWSLLVAIPVACLRLLAQSVPALTVDAAAARHAINPWIYGINQWSDSGLQAMMPIPLVRWGGDDATSYNWKASVKNNTGDNPWCYENYSVAPNFDSFHEHNLRMGATTLGTVSLMDWMPNASRQCSFSVAKYGAQQSTNPDNADCGNGILKSNNQSVNNDPNDAYFAVDQSWNHDWVQHIHDNYGPANAGGVRLWSLDNEPEWWDSNHWDVYKNGANGKRGADYDDMLARNIQAALTVKQADATALITGPVPGGWSGMLFSKQDMTAGWSKSPYKYWDNPTDQNAHGSVPWIPYYLQKMKAAEAQYGRRLLDAVDVHAYITPSGLSGSPGNAAMEKLRMTSTRALWDPNYVPGDGYEDATGADVATQLVPLLKKWVKDNYPGTMTAITEYNWGASNTITGGIAQADILGIFGREGLDIGTVWTDLKPTYPAAFAFKIFLNYDGKDSAFGDTSVSAASSDPDSLSIFAAQRSDSALTILVLNKTPDAITDTVSLANFSAGGSAQVWQYAPANLAAIVRQSDVPISGNAVGATFPGYSMTLLVVPQAAGIASVPQPVVHAVTNAASYAANGISPGEIVVVWGDNLGPQTLAYLQLDANGLVASSLANVRVRFNGVPAPLIYTTAGAVSAIVPYEVAPYQSVNVVVENSGSASAPLSVPVVAAVPAIFTHDSSGSGQGAVLNQDGGINSASNPAVRGKFVLVYATGQGVTNPPDFDGRVNGTPLPAPQLKCSGTIDGVPATSNYCGAAPGGPAGFLQVNLLVPDGVRSGSAVPVSIQIGNFSSQSGVTIAVQ